MFSSHNFTKLLKSSDLKAPVFCLHRRWHLYALPPCKFFWNNKTRTICSTSYSLWTEHVFFLFYFFLKRGRSPYRYISMNCSSWDVFRWNLNLSWISLALDSYCFCVYLKANVMQGISSQFTWSKIRNQLRCRGYTKDVLYSLQDWYLLHLKRTMFYWLIACDL